MAMYKDLTEIEGIILALKSANHEKQGIIDDLIHHGFKQNGKIFVLQRKVRTLRQVIENMGRVSQN